MIVLEWLFLTIVPCDAAEPWQLGFQDAATPMMQGIIDLHHDIFSTHFQVDEIGRYDDLVSFLLVLCLLLSVVICLMEGTHSKRKGKATATTSAGAGGSNADDDDERKRDDKYYIFKFGKTEKDMSKFLHHFTQVDHPIPFPRSPSQKDWLTVTKSICKDIYPGDPPRMRFALLSGFYTRLTINTSQNPDFPQFVEAMRKFLEDNL